MIRDAVRISSGLRFRRGWDRVVVVVVVVVLVIFAVAMVFYAAGDVRRKGCSSKMCPLYICNSHIPRKHPE